MYKDVSNYLPYILSFDVNAHRYPVHMNESAVIDMTPYLALMRIKEELAFRPNMTMTKVNFLRNYGRTADFIIRHNAVDEFAQQCLEELLSVNNVLLL